MPKKKTDIQKASGKLVSTIQREWGTDPRGPCAEFSEDVLTAAHTLLHAASADEMSEILDSKSVRQYLGEAWGAKAPIRQARGRKT